MARRTYLHLLAGLSGWCLLLTTPQPVLATIVFDDHFTGNSGGIPAGWSRIYGTGAVVEAGTTVTLGGDEVAIGSATTLDPGSGTVVIQTEISGVVGQVASGLGVPGEFPFTFFICEIRRYDGRIEVTGSDAEGGGQSYELGELLGYSGGPIRLRVVLGPTWFSASTDSPPFYSGQIDYAAAFTTFTRDDLGPAASVILFDYGDPGSSIIDRIRVSVEGASTAVDDGQVPPTLALLPPYPNPFNPRTTVSLTLPAAGHALVAIFDARGMQVVRLVDETLSAGTHSVAWPGVDSCGRAVPSGTYFCRLSTIWGVETRKLQLVR